MAENKIKKFLFPTQEDDSNEINFRRNDRSEFNGSSGMEVKEVNEEFKGFSVSDGSKKAFRTLSGDINGSNIHTPNSYGDAEKIADELLNRNAIIVNLEAVLSNPETEKDATRILDYLCGVAFALGIEVKSINTTAFFFTPISKGN